MALTPGLRLGAYEVLSLLGAGGMGEVYRARDTNLGRDVALKVLPDTFALDPERLARFRREAQVLAALNHPHIASINGLEESQGARALVLELVDGFTLSDRLVGGALPLEEAWPIARQIAEALEAAHDHGIIHRDLKPANVKVRADGTVKVLDFGLAKVFDPTTITSDSSQSPTLISPAATRIGVIMGTAAYMSPEQARGKVVDRRADVWAFGCVVYQMLVGRRAFAGDDISETIARVIEREPDWNALAAAAPRSVVRVVQRCLQKDPQNRIRDSSATRDSSCGTRWLRPDRRRLLRSSLALGRRGIVALAAMLSVGLALGVLGTRWVLPRLTGVSTPPAVASIGPRLSTEINLPADALPGSGRRGGRRRIRLDAARYLARRADAGLRGIVERHRSVVHATAGQLYVQPLAGTEGALHPFFGRTVDPSAF